MPYSHKQNYDIVAHTTHFIFDQEHTVRKRKSNTTQSTLLDIVAELRSIA